MGAFDPTRPCGTRTRAPGRYTRKELDDIAMAYGIRDFKQMTMDALCDALKKGPKRKNSSEPRSGTSYTDSSRREEPRQREPRSNQPSTSTNTPISKELDVMHMLGEADATTLSIEIFVRLYLRIHPWLMLGANDSKTATKNFRKMSLKIHPDKCKELECKLAMQELTCSLANDSLRPPSLYDHGRSISPKDRKEALAKLQELRDSVFRAANPPTLTAIQKMKQEARNLGVPSHLLEGVDRQTLEDLIREYKARANGTWKDKNAKEENNKRNNAKNNRSNAKNNKSNAAKNNKSNAKNNRGNAGQDVTRKKKSMAWFKRVLRAAAMGIMEVTCLRPRVKKTRPN
jgi:hypothetical protein